jgi:putative two-component system response regulator
MEKREEKKKTTVLIVDDTPDNIVFLSSLLRDSYRVLAATSGPKVLEIIESGIIPDIILLDIVMPDMDGYEVCRLLKENPKSSEVPVLFLTSRSDVEDERRGFELGAVDFITRPVSSYIVKARLTTQLEIKASRDFLRDKSAYLAQEVERRVRENLTIQDVAMVALGSLAETRDNETGEHIKRTQRYMEILARELKDNPHFEPDFANGAQDLMIKSAPLHDIGKVGIPDSILLKPGSLTDAEFAIMKTHTTLGHDAIMRAEKLVDSTDSFLRFARDIAYTHHEKWDGTGYPRGISGTDIPVAGRLMAIADVYDALISKRIYKGPMTQEAAAAIIIDGAGTQFDPEIVDAFCRCRDQMAAIAQTTQ